ncbi:MAG: ribonuclease P protein component [Calditrichota bacterium]
MRCAVTDDFPRRLSLKGDRDFKALFERGTSFQTRHVRVFFLGDGNLRIGFGVPKRIGKAALRNLLKRRMREIFRRNKSFFPEHGAVLFIIRQPVDFTVLRQEMIYLGRRLIQYSRNLVQPVEFNS